MTQASERLRSTLRAEPPPAVLALDEDALAAVVELVDAARRRQNEALRESFDRALRHVPFPARSVVKKVLLG